MKSKASQKTRFVRIISTPVRALSKARDFYVKSITDYADRINYGGAMAIPVSSGLPRSFSARSHTGEELDRAYSTKILGELEQKMKTKAGPRALRSGSVAMGRIDEDRPCCYFGEDSEIKYPRSRSHAVSGRRLSAL